MLGVNIALIQDGKILLTKRGDFEVWCLPGGHVDPGESLAQAAIRETLEETGLETRLTHLIGVYSRPKWHKGVYNIVFFGGEIIGGSMKPQPEEVIEMQFFALDELPADLMIGHRERVLDAFAGVGGSLVRTEAAAWPFDDGIDRSAVYSMKASSGLTPAAFYYRYFGDAEYQDDIAGLPLNRRADDR